MAEADDYKHEQEQLEEEAVSWLVRLTSGNATEADHRAAQAWQQQSPAHQHAFEKAQRLWGGMEALRDSLTSHDEQPEREFVSPQTGKARPPIRRIPFQRAWLGQAAIAASIAVLAFTFMVQTHVLTQWQADYYTDMGQQATWQLSDGSVVQLNTHAAVTIDYSDHTRHVHLLEGEAAFRVANDADRPFLVHANGGTVRAVGTEFLVNTTEEQAVVTVVEGVVDVTDEQQQDTPTRLTVGQRVRYGVESGISPVETVDLHVATAWQRGKLIFEATPLTKVVDQINRYRPGHIVILNDALESHEVSGVFDLDRLDAAVETIEKTLPVTSLHVTDRYIFLQ